MSIKKVFRGEGIGTALNTDALNQMIDGGYRSTHEDETLSREDAIDEYYLRMWGSQIGYLQEGYPDEHSDPGPLGIKYRDALSSMPDTAGYLDPEQWPMATSWLQPMYGVGSTNPAETHEFMYSPQGLYESQTGMACYQGVVQAIVFYPQNMQHCRRVDLGPDGRLTAMWEGRGWVIWKEASKDDEVECVCVVSFESPQHQVVMGTSDSQISPGQDGQINIEVIRPDDQNPPSAKPTITASLDWMHGNEPIGPDTRVGCMWFPREKAWRILWAECPDDILTEGYIQHSYASGTVQQSLSANTPDLVDTSVWDTAYSTSDATADVSNGRITLPNVPAGGQNYNAEFSATVNSSIAHTEVKFFHYVNGTQLDLISTATNVDATHDMSLSGFSLMSLSSGTAPSVEIYVEADKAITLTYSDIKTKISKNVRI